MADVKIINILPTTAATTTSGSVFVGGAKRIGLLLRRTLHSAGNTVFTFGGSMEPADTVTPTMTALSMIIINKTNSNVQDLTRDSSVTLSSNTDNLVWLDPACCLSWINVTATRTTDGSATAYMIAEY